MHMKDAIHCFLVAFSSFETHSVGMALRSLSRDAVFVEHAEHLLDFEARLKLLERMAFARGIPSSLMAELEACLLLARSLHERRDEVARNLTSESTDSQAIPFTKVKSRRFRRRTADFSRLAQLEDMLLPDLARIQVYTKEARELQDTLQALTAKLERHVTEVGEQA